MDPVEIELKFQVPAAARAAVQSAVATASAQTLPLAAAYVDTADERLARAGLALRLRREGSRWVQTLKGRGDGLMTRLEHEVLLPRGRPVLDPQRHAGTAVGTRLLALLADGAPLHERYRTQMRRTLRRVRSGGASIELAFDRGSIVAGTRRLPVCELEFELVAGPPQGLLALAARWVQRHGLWLDVRTKSERGHRLALGLDTVPAARVRGAALAQLLPNAAELAAGSGTAEHLRLLRAALRRLQAAQPGWDTLAQRLSARGDGATPAAAGAVLREPVFTRAVLQALAAPPQRAGEAR